MYEETCQLAAHAQAFASDLKRVGNILVRKKKFPEGLLFYERALKGELLIIPFKRLNTIPFREIDLSSVQKVFLASNL